MSDAYGAVICIPNKDLLDLTGKTWTLWIRLVSKANPRPANRIEDFLRRLSHITQTIIWNEQFEGDLEANPKNVKEYVLPEFKPGDELDELAVKMLEAAHRFRVYLPDQLDLICYLETRLGKHYFYIAFK